jgi:hypothetical protein
MIGSFLFFYHSTQRLAATGRWAFEAPTFLTDKRLFKDTQVF